MVADARFLDQLQTELDAWQRQGVVGAEPARRILAHYGLAPEAADEAWINTGLTFFVLLVVARYFDFFFALMDRSLAFIVAGVVLLGGGYLLERSRRRLLETMRRADDDSGDGDEEVDHAVG